MTTLNSFFIPATSTALTTATTLYTAGDQVDGIWSWNLGVAKGFINAVDLTNSTVNLGACNLFLFDRSITTAGNNAPHSISDADRKFSRGYISLPYPENDGTTAGQTASVDSLIRPFSCNAATTLYGVLVTLSTHTIHFGAVGDLQITLCGVGDV